MRIIGLCGRSGSGKGSFCKIAADYGFKIIDCDAVYKKLVSQKTPCLLEIAKHFGEEAIKDNSLNRRYLAPIVFSNTQKLNLLNSITHKYIKEEINNVISTFPLNANVIIDAPTLFESGIDKDCHIIIGVIADDEVCAERIILRDNISKEEAVKRISAQLSNDEIAQKSDLLLYNNGNIEDLKAASAQLIKSVLEYKGANDEA